MENLKEKELNFGEICKYASEIFKGNFKIIMLFSLLIYLPLTSIMYFYMYRYIVLEIYVYALFFSIFMNFRDAISTASISKLILDKEENKTISFAVLFSTFFKKLHKILFTSLIFTIIIYIGFMLLLIPGIYLSIVLIFYSCYIGISDSFFIDSFKKSSKLVKGRWFKTFLDFFSIYFLINIFKIIIYLIAFLLGIFNYLFFSLIIFILIESFSIYGSIFISTMFINRYLGEKSLEN